MSELLPCPFCGGEVEHQLMYDGAYSFTCPKCGLNARWADDIARAVPEMIEDTEKFWNTRFERTCHIEHKKLEGLPVEVCSECDAIVSYGMAPILAFCPNCGAKVVDELDGVVE